MRTLFTLILIMVAITGFAQKRKGKQPVTQPMQSAQTAPTTTDQKPADTTKVQEQQQTTLGPLIEHYLRKRDLAIRWNDAATAQDALYDLIADTRNDSLAYLLAIDFYGTQQYAPCVLVCKDLLQGNPKNVEYLKLSAAGYEGLGLKDKALANYESLFLLTDNNTAILYKMSNLQYELKKYPECKANVDILLTKADLDSLSVSVNLPDNKTKEYPIKVAILNLKGLVAAQSKDMVGAKKAFQEALALAPDFPMAKDNLSKMK